MKPLNLLEDHVRALFLKYLIPSVSATFVTSIYILADTVMIGRGVGAVGIAALNLLLPLFSLFFGTGVLLGVGGGVLFSVSKGKGEEKKAREYFTVGFVCAVLFSLFYLTMGYLFFGPITGFLGNNESMAALVEQYGKILIAGAPAFLFSAFLQAFVRNDKAPKVAMAAVIAGGVSNVVLDYIFIFPMKMGMAGAAVATVIGSLITIGILLSHFFSPSNTLKFTGDLSAAKAGKVIANGVSSFLIEMSGGIIIFLFNRQLLAYVGNLGVVVYGIISNSALIVSSVSNGIAQAAQPLMAVNFGAGREKRVRETRKYALTAEFIAGALFVAAGLFLPRMITEIFVKADESILTLSVPAVRMYFLSFSAMGANLLFSTYFQSVMKPFYALLVCLLRGIVLSGVLVFLLPAVLGVNGIWMTMPVTEFITLAVCTLLNIRICELKTDMRK
ncbi:MATE family efflux transporter [Clostridium sp. chh4-2]|uniref:MATE family efflux transporter n=1 Tax=Clostridium sp. chh4-2 TaxID=2067550 RepID=UPI000CCF5E2A|nr:MATE family efflux transporter [Clostridium sp. chh4-2]PNV63470.1 MATE family efflux transporter [Clostridium sp. chh4-2]